MPSTSPPPLRMPWRRSPALAALFGWVLPGLGHLYVGRPVKGALFLASILPTFLVGWYLTGFVIVDPSRYGLDFVAQISMGAPAIAALRIGSAIELEHLPRFFEVGRLYALVAGLLNLVSMYDAVGEAIVHNRAVHSLRRAMRSGALEAPEAAPLSAADGPAAEETP